MLDHIPTFEEKVRAAQKATEGEIEQVTDAALGRIYPDQLFKFANLKTITGGKLSKLYLNPQNDSVIVDVTEYPAHGERRKNPYGGKRKYIYEHVPYKRTLTLYNEKGQIDTRITVEEALQQGEYDKKSILCISSIKEYYPPPPRKQRGHDSGNDDSKSVERRIDLDRAEQRDFKKEQQVNEQEEDNFSNPASGYEGKFSFGKGSKPRTRRDYGQMDSLEEQDDSAPTALHGSIRRERTFKLIQISRYDRSPKPVMPETYSLWERLGKDRTNHKNGDYTVVQYAGGGFTTTKFNSAGIRLEQHTYNSENELTKALGEDAQGATPRKRRNPIPSDGEMARRVKDRQAERDLRSERDEWQR